MFTIFGFPINLSNLYQANQLPIAAFGVIDGWPYVHYVMPYLFRLFIGDIAAMLFNMCLNFIAYYLLHLLNTLSICFRKQATLENDTEESTRILNKKYFTGFTVSFLFMFGWESGEAIVAGIVRTIAILHPTLFPASYVDWFGETAFDSQVGDVLQGTIGIFMAEFVYRFKCGFEEGIFSTTTTKTKAQSWRRFGQYMIIGMFTICTTVFSPLEGVDVEEVFGHTIPFGWTAIPVGFCLYGLSVIIVITWMFFEDIYQTKMFTPKRIIGITMAYACTGIYFTLSFVSCSLFNIGTYFMLWFMTPIIFFIIAIL
jgi:hypothetical protein